jgi:hypothetical protein
MFFELRFLVDILLSLKLTTMSKAANIPVPPIIDEIKYVKRKIRYYDGWK